MDGDDRSIVRIWDLGERRTVRDIAVAMPGIVRLAMSANGGRLIVAGPDRVIAFATETWDSTRAARLCGHSVGLEPNPAS